MDIGDLFEFINDDNDEAIVEHLEYVNRPRRHPVFRDRLNHFEIWDDVDFFARFRLSKVTVQRILNQIRAIIASPTERNHALSPSVMVVLAIRFYATGSFLITLADFAGIHKSTASKAIHKVTRAIASLHRQYIKMPATQEEVTDIRQRFYNIARFPRCIGSLDCTHIKIQSPGGDNAETFRNRKGFFSLNVQTICGPDLKINNIVARWPGSAHDSTVFANSSIRGKFERGEMGNSILVGDSGYPIKNYLITPLTNPQTPAEQLFNESLIRTRNPVERSYGVWKRRFPVLAYGIRLLLCKSEALIVATAVLHNIAIDMKEAQPPANAELEAAIQMQLVNNMQQVHANNVIGANNVTRNTLINQYYQGLL